MESLSPFARFLAASLPPSKPNIQLDISDGSSYPDDSRAKQVLLPTATFHLLGMSDGFSNVITVLHRGHIYHLAPLQCCYQDARLTFLATPDSYKLLPARSLSLILKAITWRHDKLELLTRATEAAFSPTLLSSNSLFDSTAELQ